MAKSSSSIAGNPFFIFWLGVLTGAIIIGLIFSYQAYKVANLQNAILQGQTSDSLWNPME